jgi:hypothetical protein
MEVSGQLRGVAALRSGKTLPVFIGWMIGWAPGPRSRTARVLDWTTIAFLAGLLTSWLFCAYSYLRILYALRTCWRSCRICTANDFLSSCFMSLCTRKWGWTVNGNRKPVKWPAFIIHVSNVWSICLLILKSIVGTWIRLLSHTVIGIT